MAVSPTPMSVPASIATSPTPSTPASWTSMGRRGGRRVPRSMPFSHDADIPTSPAKDLAGQAYLIP